MTINIKDLSDIGKILAFIRVQSKGTFTIPESLRGEMINRILDWGKKNHVSISFVKPDGEKIAACTALGAAVGMVLGWVLFSAEPLIGAFIGTLSGGLGGYAAAHLTIQVSPGRNDGMAMLTIL